MWNFKKEKLELHIRHNHFLNIETEKNNLTLNMWMKYDK